MFTYQIDYLEVERVLRTTVRGHYDLAAHVQLCEAANSVAAQHGVNRILADFREAELAIGLTELNDVQKRGLKGDYRIAFVYDPSHSSAEQFELFEKIAWMAGFERRLFIAPELAMAWLTCYGLVSE